MSFVNEYLTRRPFDLYGIELVKLVASARSFTVAAQNAGLTQSAITRHIQGIEERVGARLFERTTRTVKLTEAGEYFVSESRRIAGDVENLTQQMTSRFSDAPPIVRIGLARSVGLSYYPGFLMESRRKQPELLMRISQDLSPNLLQQLEAGDLDVAVVTAPPKLSDRLQAAHRFEDAFVFVAPKSYSLPPRATLKALTRWSADHPWILLDENTETGRLMRRWLRGRGFSTQAAMQADNFDLIINLVAMGLGVSLVPHRALALYARNHHIQRIRTKDRFTRKLSVVVRKHRALSTPIKAFVDNILF
jgi:DNA-binding transcriptional LysR family regulator